MILLKTLKTAQHRGLYSWSAFQLIFTQPTPKIKDESSCALNSTYCTRYRIELMKYSSFSYYDSTLKIFIYRKNMTFPYFINFCCERGLKPQPPAQQSVLWPLCQRVLYLRHSNIKTVDQHVTRNKNKHEFIIIIKSEN